MEGRGEICFFDEEEEDTEICLFLGVEEGWKEGRRRDQWRVVKTWQFVAIVKYYDPL